MAYVKKGIVSRRRSRGMSGLSGLGGAADCGANQNFYPNLTFAGVTGQCSTPSEAAAALKSGTATGNMDGAAGGTYVAGGGGFVSAALDWGAKLLGGAITPQTPQVVAPANTGMSTTTKVAIAGGAVLLVALIASR